MRTVRIVAAGLAAVLALSDAAEAVQNRGAARNPQQAPRAAQTNRQAAPRVMPRSQQSSPRNATLRQEQASPRVVTPRQAPQQAPAPKAQAQRRAAIVTQSAMKTASAKSQPRNARPAAPPQQPAGMAARQPTDTRSPEQKAHFQARAAKALQAMEPWQMNAMRRNEMADSAMQARRSGDADRAARAAQQRVETQRSAEQLAATSFFQQRAAERLADMPAWQVVALRRNELAERAERAEKTGQMDRVVLAKERRRELEEAAAAIPPEPHVPNSLSPNKIGGEVRFSQPHEIYRQRALGGIQSGNGGN